MTGGNQRGIDKTTKQAMQVLRIACQFWITDSQSLTTDLQEVDQIQILRGLFHSVGQFQELMSNTDMTADQHVDALRAEGLEDDMQ